MSNLASALPAGCDLVFVLPHLGPGGAQKVALLAAKHFLADGLSVALVTLLPGHVQAHDLPEGLCWVDLGGDVASARRQRSMKVRTARLLHRWLALLLVAASWPLLQGIKPGRHGGVVRWLLVGLIGPQALLLHRLLAQTPPQRVMSMLTRTNLLCCQALWMLPGHLVISERNDPSRQRLSFPWPRLQGWLWCRADRVTANTAGVLDALQRRNPEIASRMNLLPNPLVLGSAHRDAIGWSDKFERTAFIAVCRLVPQKGIDLLLEAYAALSPAIHSQWRLLIIGEGPERAALEQRTSDLQLAERIHFLGFQPDPSRYFRDAGVFVLPSRFEGMPNALLEAMGCGLASIVSDASPGPLEVVSDEQSGLVVPSGSIAALTTAMERLVLDAALRRQLGQRAAATMRQHSWSVLDQPWRDVLALPSA